MVWIALLVTVVIAYLIGAIPVGLVLGKALKGIDIREYGSGKTGATNVLRALGWGPAIATLMGDVAKGTVGVLIGRSLLVGFGVEASYYGEVIGGLAAIAGHNWPIYIGGRGGRGVATALGAALALSPLTSILALPVALTIIAISDMASLGSLLGTVLGLLVIGALIALGQLTPVYAIFALFAGGMIVFQHRDNIHRLLRGEERKLGIKSKLRGRASASSADKTTSASK
jgi:glycerol-3-phosphate acyltransferase PlsY